MAVFDPSKEQHIGIIVGKELVYHDGMSRFMAIPGDDVKISFPTAGQPPKISSDNFTVVDIHESKMSGHDSNFVFMPLRRLQEMRGMIDPSSGIGRVNAIQIRLREDVDVQAIRAEIAAAFPKAFFKVDTWQDKVGPLLAAVSMEKSVLNILLFLIIAVAGFGILAIFFMIVVEKTKDIGILKALGASRRGVLGIFLGYGLSLGIVGSGMGSAAGAGVCLEFEHDSRLVGVLYRSKGFRSLDLLLLQNSDDHRTVDCLLDRGRRVADRRLGKHPARDSRGQPSSCPGPAL